MKTGAGKIMDGKIMDGKTASPFSVVKDLKRDGIWSAHEAS